MKKSIINNNSFALRDFIFKSASKALISLLIAFSFACEDLVEVNPPKTQLISATVFESDLTATAAISSIYSGMRRSSSPISGGTRSIAILAGLSSDEFNLHSSVSLFHEFNDNAITTTNTYVSTMWLDFYSFIYSANAIIEGLANSTSITPEVSNQLQGEAKFIRAFCHFYLVNLFGNVPFITTTDYRKNTEVSRMSKTQVYEQIISDLMDAQSLLVEDYSFSKGERVRPNKYTALALLSRVYLYIEDWENAELQASYIIDKVTLYSLATLDNVFLKNSTEAIWQLIPVLNSTWEGRNLKLTRTPTLVSLSDELVSTFEIDDDRRSNWVGSYTSGADTWFYPYKYKVQSSSAPQTEYSMIFRLGEQYLIRAEARARQNDLDNAIADLNTIRDRAGLDATTASTQTELLNAIEQERRVELFTEWGHRWLDLKRTDRVSEVFSTEPGWDDSDILYPIPESEILVNPNITQNYGY